MIGGKPDPKGMLEEPLPPWLKNELEKISQLALPILPVEQQDAEKEGENQLRPFFDKPPNHVLINEYLPSQGIMVSTQIYLPFPFC